MKTITCIALAVILPLSAAAEAPKTSIIASSYRVWVKDGHDEAFKKAIAAHAQKYHVGAWKWRVYEVTSGPDSGAYHIVEGPNSWSVIDERGDLGKAHGKHYETAMLPHISKTGPNYNASYMAEHSTTAAGNFSNKTILNHVVPKPGRVKAYLDSLKATKSTWEKRGANIAVWSLAASGEPAIVVARRLKNGLKDLEPGDKSFSASYDEINGAGAYDKSMEEYARDVERRYSELIEYRAELSSK